MKKKRWQQWLAFLLAFTMLVSTEGTVLAQSQGTVKLTSQEEAGTKDLGETEESEADRDIVLPASVEGWSDGYETALRRRRQMHSGIRTGKRTCLSRQRTALSQDWRMLRSPRRVRESWSCPM